MKPEVSPGCGPSLAGGVWGRDYRPLATLSGNYTAFTFPDLTLPDFTTCSMEAMKVDLV